MDCPASRIVLLAAVVLAQPACRFKSQPVETEAGTGQTTTLETVEAGYGPEVGQAIYEDLVEAVREYHVFTDQTWENLGFTWDDELPRLEKEFQAIEDRDDLVRALNHFANSLHNPHCHYGSPDRPAYMTPGFVVDVEWIDDEPRFYLAEIHDEKLEDQVQPGDTLVSYQGVPEEDFLTSFHLESNGNHWRAVARDIAAFFSRRSPHKHGALDEAEWGFQRPGTEEVVALKARWGEPETDGHPGEFGIEYDEDGCAGLPGRQYGEGYALVERGANFCIYAAASGPSSAFPVVRQFSFSYSGKNGFSAVKADHHNLKKDLGELGNARGVILDLRDNRGGNNPHWFLDWWAPATPYKSTVVYTRLHEDLDTTEKLEKVRITGFGPPHFESYLKALAGKKPGDAFMEGRPFFCPPAGCEGFDNVYHPKNQVTTLPVAILVGPRCVSSCDDVVRTFRTYDLGPVIGMAGSAGLTIKRMQHAVVHPQSGEELGFVALAFSYETCGKTGEKLEAVVVDPHHVLEPTFENRERYDELLVTTAIGAFETFEFPTTD